MIRIYTILVDIIIMVLLLIKQHKEKIKMQIEELALQRQVLQKQLEEH